MKSIYSFEISLPEIVSAKTKIRAKVNLFYKIIVYFR